MMKWEKETFRHWWTDVKFKSHLGAYDKIYIKLLFGINISLVILVVYFITRK